MNVDSLRSSRSSYGDPRYLSAYSNGVSSLPSKVLVDGYRGTSDLSNDDRSQYSTVSPNPQRGPLSIDVTDPVLMHLLTETAIGDSIGYEILPFEEVEDLKREYAFLSNRIEATKRKLALETKLRDAAQSLRRLHRPKSTRNGTEPYLNGHTNGVIPEPDEDADDEFAVSSRKCEELAQELWKLERRAQHVHRRILEHTAGILQLTHKGLKKNVNQNGANQSTNGVSRGSVDFDDRSLYKTVDSLDDFGPDGRRVAQNGIDVNVIRNTEQKLEELNGRLRDLILRGQEDFDLDPLPQSSNDGDAVKSPALVQAHLAYLENSLNTLETRGLQVGGVGGSAGEIEAQLSEINNRLHSLLGQAGSVLSPSHPPPPSPSGEYLHTHMDYLRSGFEDLQRRVQDLQEQKSILTTQIQQQRELNSKSDAERDAHVADLTQQLVEARKRSELSEQEVQGLRDELAIVMEQLDAARQEQSLQEQQRQQEESAALNAERQARERAEEEVSRLQQAVQQASAARSQAEEQVSQLQQAVQEATVERSQAEEQVSQLQQAVQQATEARSQAEEEAKRLQNELSEMEREVARAQTELTVVKAELDGAYGTRAERAAEVAANPVIQKEIEDLRTKNTSLAEELAALKEQQSNQPNAAELQERVQTLEKELRDTIEDYEVMTKASIEFEKEREKYESIIDGLRDRCENLETQLSEERITWMGVNSPTAVRDGASETTVSMMVLKNEFKKMMRETRAENMKLLKASLPYFVISSFYVNPLLTVVLS
ncbi:Involucrin repeat protein [Rasamsonia emersonii CBS 393.64]|uniref:Involucrin repeat protein n=1 Tax=Rasamsonia emersonii (strain ATCC 16479 / CBS 393.64 / IMI 116815) TaxID=1408163 RepID=A0A0F4YU23_RASE3|nr:Involucrin repeat protein [Rasamsonia emersonii CBS 393.64]KKA21724.1 Involucrin repeat protein [Rasamsonia emersonii CBS 393.64]